MPLAAACRRRPLPLPTLRRAACRPPAEGAREAAKIGAAVVGAGLGAFLTKQLAAKRQSAAIIELSNLLVRGWGKLRVVLLGMWCHACCLDLRPRRRS